MKAISPHYLARPQLSRQLDMILSYPMTVLQAPMGFGKTSAIHDFLSRHDLPTISLSLIGYGGSLAYCWERITSQIRRRDPALGQQLVNLGFPTDAPQIAKIIDLLNDCTLSSPTLLFVDDYHLIDCPQTADLLSLIASERIPNLHIILAARELLCLPVMELSQKGLCHMIGQEDLRFHPDDISVYFQMMEVPIRPYEAKHIAQWTGGWISGIYLIAHGYQRGITDLHLDDIDQLLEASLYNVYPPKTRHFLEKLSFLDAYTPEQLAYVLEDPSAPSFLLSLVRGNAFLTYNHSIHSYQMTDLLRDFLRKKATQNGIDPTRLYCRMGQWFLDHDRQILAYDYLYRGGSIDTILEAMNRADYTDILFTQFTQIQQIFESLSEDVMFQYPLAELRYIRVQALTLPKSGQMALHDRLARMEAHFLQSKLPEEQRTRILGEIHNTWLLVSFNNANAMVEHAAKAVQYFNGRFSCLISNKTEFTYGAATLLYCYYTEPGRLKETVELIANGFPILAQAVDGCGSGSETLIQVEYALETGNLDTVSMYAYKAIYQSRMYHQIGIEICATFALCRLAVVQGNFQEADRLIAQLSTLVEEENNSVYNTTMDICTAYIDCLMGRVAHIPQWLLDNDHSFGSFMYRGLGFHHIVTGQAALLEGRYLQLLVLCDSFEQGWNLYGTQLGLIYCNIFRAAAHAALNGLNAAEEALCKALDIAVQDGVVLPFVEMARVVLPLLTHPNVQQRYPAEFLQKIQTLAAQRSPCPAVEEGNIQLTVREQEILSLLADGKRHEEIASALYISVPTVRFHIKNIYHKLGAHNKVSALQAAHQLGLL